MKNKQTNDIDWDIEPEYSNRVFKWLVAIAAIIAVASIIFLTSCTPSEKLANKRFNQAMQASKPITAQNCINSFPVVPSVETIVKETLVPGDIIIQYDTVHNGSLTTITKTITKTMIIRKDSIYTVTKEQTGYITITKDNEKKISVLTADRDNLRVVNRRLIYVVVIMGIFILIFSAIKLLK